PPEDGIAINFGYDPEGFGQSTSAPVVEEVTEVQEEQSQVIREVVSDPVVTQETVEAPTITETTTERQPDPEPVVEEPQPSETLTERLQRIREGRGSGEGETEGGGDQGNPEGDPNSPSRTGAGGTGNSGNYRLGNRQALSRPRPQYNCPDEGRVVVKVQVNRSGKVVQADAGANIPGGPASNTISSCLFEKATTAALNTTWQGDPNAPERQIG